MAVDAEQQAWDYFEQGVQTAVWVQAK